MDVCDHECTCKFKSKENKNLWRTTKCSGPTHPTLAPPFSVSTAHTSTNTLPGRPGQFRRPLRQEPIHGAHCENYMSLKTGTNNNYLQQVAKTFLLDLHSHWKWTYETKVKKCKSTQGWDHTFLLFWRYCKNNRDHSQNFETSHIIIPSIQTSPSTHTYHSLTSLLCFLTGRRSPGLMAPLPWPLIMGVGTVGIPS